MDGPVHSPVLWSMDLTICQKLCHLHVLLNNSLFYGIDTCINRKCTDSESQRNVA